MVGGYASKSQMLQGTMVRSLSTVHARKQRNKAKNVDPYLKNSEDGLECMRHRSIDPRRQSEREGLAGREWIQKSGEEENEMAHVLEGDTGSDGDEPHRRHRADLLGNLGTGNDDVNLAGRVAWVDDGDEAGSGS